MPIPESEQRKLFVRSGNRCAFTGCRRLLTAEGSQPERLVVLGEIAHIVAERPLGPRGNSDLTLEERNRTENLILLCNIHHQLIDSQPQTYAIDRLRAMKEAHEEWVEKTLGRGKDEESAAPPRRVTEAVYSTLLPVTQTPRYIYGAPYEGGEQTVQRQLGQPRNGEILPYILKEKMLYAFQDLGEQGNPFGAVVLGQPVERFHVDEWWTDPDRLGWFIDLLNRALSKLTRRRSLRHDRDHDRYYFASNEPGVGFSIRYKPLNQKYARRQVVWQPKRKATGEARPYWYHRAVALKFIRTREASWVLNIRPELRITVDGIRPLPPEIVGARITRKKSRTFNYDLLAEVQFWRDYLSESKPRIILSFGHPGQMIVIGANLLQGQVEWPGIPSEHAKPFKNVEYLDDLFTWAEIKAIESGLEDDGEDERKEDNGVEAREDEVDQ